MQITASPYAVFSPSNLVRLLWQRTVRAATTFPTLRGWLETLALFALVAVPAYFISTSYGWYTRPPADDPAVWVAKFAGALIAPALIEEIICRVWMVPHRSEVVTRTWRWGVWAGALFFYVIIHPINGMISGGFMGELFVRPSYIIIVTMLGIACLASYHRTGSLYAPTLIHALIVGSWSILRG